jgi:hypothetical protein
MTGRRSTRGLRGVLERRRAELEAERLGEDAGAKTELEEAGVDWPLERDDPERERSHPGASKGDGS